MIGDGSERLYGRLEGGENLDGIYTWTAMLSILEKDDTPWYGPSWGEKPVSIGNIKVNLHNHNTAANCFQSGPCSFSQQGVQTHLGKMVHLQVHPHSS